MGRIIIFTGKGGVGKTSVAAAHARHSANEGVRTLLVSTDMAHNLSDLFGTAIGREEREVAPCLTALEIDPNHMLEHEFADIKKALMKLMENPVTAGADIDGMMFFPGMDELFCLLKIAQIYESKRFERIIVDCAPTGETLALLKFPEMISWYMEHLFPIGKIAVRVLAPISKLALKVELPNKKAMNDIERVYVKMMALQELLKNREVTSIRLVAIPEKMVVEETKRNYMYMNLYNFQVDGLYINRILPADVENIFFDEWMKIQNGYVEELETVFSGVPVSHIPWFDSDINGLSGIDRLDWPEYLREQPFEVRSHLQNEQYEKTETGYLLRLYLPCANKEEIVLHESDRDVIIKIGNYKRSLPRPDALRGYGVAGAALKEGMLTLSFKKEDI